MQLRNIIDGLWRGADTFAHPLKKRQNNAKVLTIVQVVTSVQPQTFTGSASMITSTVGSSTPTNNAGGSVLVGGAVRPTQSASSSEQSVFSSTAGSDDDSAASSTAAASSTVATSRAAQSSRPGSTASSQVSQITSAPIAIASPSKTQGLANSQSASASVNTNANASDSASASPTAAASSGMSGGAKAGLAFGILFLIGALLAGVIILYRRQKQQKEAHGRLDDEKAAMSTSSSPDSLPRNPEPVHPATPAAASVARSKESPSPRLDIRPVTQFDPRLSTMNTGAPAAGAALGGAAAVGAVGGAALAVNNSPRATSPSSWEKRGAIQHANDPTNPFGNHAETLNNTSPQSVQTPTIPEVSTAHNSIDASDFPLPISGPVSPNPLSMDYESSTESLPNPVVPYAPATVSNVSLPVSEIAAAGVAGVVVTGVGAVAVVAGKGGNSPPLDNVHRVQLDFKPSMEDELEIHAGQLVRLLHEYDDGWALCTRMDRSQQGVVPRTCLSKQMVKPRPNPNHPSPSGAPPSAPPQQPRPGPGPRGPGPNGKPQMRGPGPQMMSGNGSNPPAPFAQVPRPLTPTGRNSPAPYQGQGGRASPAPFAQAPRPMSPAGGPQGQRSRAMSNAPYRTYQPGPQGPNGQQQRSQSPGPYGPPGMMRPPPITDNNRHRSNSLSNVVPRSAPIVAGDAPMVTKTPSLTRKPVPGQAV
ncbi:hypothetical protein BLS_008158 [Venturia inaequalis]|uniref:SH3 domain-containing protein n=1 Tax=Venturia inaequalis TaxID=5025 RepID=A0A8H3UHB7_VENIN|nr:hypothetical protein EG327_010355 [Venturia inaequalis]KAE9980829.1 hypothetical protein BLS_008158 [Venturia inaequalis]RDI81418.1 hypothetical protein Vi05172_g8541 [Venturia inaequalis]